MAAAVAFAVVRLTGGDGGTPRVSGVASIDSEGRVASFTQAGRTPSNVAVGEDAVWVLDADDRTITQIDPQSGDIVKTFSTGTTPKDIVVGGGALWIGNTSRARLHRKHLEDRSGVHPRDPDARPAPPGARPGRSPRARGQPARRRGRFPLGDQSDGTVTRFDAETGELQATVAEATSFGGIAFGSGGVWVVGEGPNVTPIDPKTNQVGKPIPVNATGLAGIATGAGSVWAAAPGGRRLEDRARRQPVARTIAVGRGVVALAFGEGALWAANYADGTVARIDPATNEVTRRAMPGNLQGIAAGAGSAWVSVVGGRPPVPLDRRLRAARVGRAKPRPADRLRRPAPGRAGQQARPIVDAIRFVLRRHGFQAGSYAVGYHSCDDATAQADWFSDVKCMANARAYAAAEQVVAVIGPYNSLCAQWELPITNRAPSGPVPVISPSNTYAGLTRSPSNLRPDEPGSLYPTGVRHYFRVVADDEVQGVAAALLASRLAEASTSSTPLQGTGGVLRGCSRWGSRPPRKLGLRLAGARSWEPAASYAALAERVARARPDGVFLAGFPSSAERCHHGAARPTRCRRRPARERRLQRS